MSKLLAPPDIDPVLTVSSDLSESEWLDAVYRTYNQKVFRTCLRFAAGDRQWAHDRAQDAFVKLVDVIDTVRDRQDPGGWLYRVAVNTCLMSLRRRTLTSRVLSAVRVIAGPLMDEPEPRLRAQRALSELETFIAELPPKERAIMVLVYVEQKSQTEAGEILGLSKGQISKLHARAIAKLKARSWELDDA